MIGLASTIIKKLPTTLATLPAPSEVDFGGCRLGPFSPPAPSSAASTLTGATGGAGGDGASVRLSCPPAGSGAQPVAPATTVPIPCWSGSPAGAASRSTGRGAWQASLAAVGLPADPVWARRLAERAGPGGVPFTSPAGGSTCSASAPRRSPRRRPIRRGFVSLACTGKLGQSSVTARPGSSVRILSPFNPYRLVIR